MPKPKVNTHLRFANPDYEPDEDFDPDSVLIARTVAPAINANMHAERMYQAESIYLTALALSKKGYCVCHGGMPTSIVTEAAREAAALFGEGLMDRGNFTIDGDEGIVASKREDHIVRLHEHLTRVGGPDHADVDTLLGLDGALHRFGEAVCKSLARLDRPQERFGRAPDGGHVHYTGRTDTMVSCYPGGGARYGVHIDNIDGDGRRHLDFGRCFTVLYYLNSPEWDEEADGGSLRIHLLHEALEGSGESGIPAVDIVPRGDTLVIFRADQMLHEVRPAKAQRFAMSMWLYGGSDAHHAAWQEEGASPMGRF